MREVPTIDQEPAGPLSEKSLAVQREQLELRFLQADAATKEHINKEGAQRYLLRYFAVGMCTCAILFMGCLVTHLSHKVLLKALAVNATYVVGLYVAPIVAINTLVIALLVAAFRTFKPGDEEKGVSALTAGVESTVGFLR